MSISFLKIFLPNNFSDSIQNPDVNFFLDNIASFDTEYFLPSEVKIGFVKFESPDTFSELHLNIKSFRKNFGDLKELYETLDLKFSIAYFSETWADENKFENDSLVQLPGYVLHHIRKTRRGEGTNIFVHKSLFFKKRQDLGINSEAMVSISIKIFKKMLKI